MKGTIFIITKDHTITTNRRFVFCIRWDSISKRRVKRRAEK